VRCALLLIGALALAACDEAAQVPPRELASQQSTAPTGAAADALGAQRLEPAIERNATLFADGIQPPGAVASALRFGQPRAAVLAAMEPALGKPVVSRNEECGAGPMAFAAYGPLTLNFIDDRFAGWNAREGARVATADGVTLGMALGAIRTERSAALVSGSTLDGEFEYATAAGGTIGGFLRGEGEAARVTGLHAGVNCFFR